MKQMSKEHVYQVSELSFQIAEAAITGMLFEVAASPSPGLVSPFSNGIHKDMDYFTFLRSTPTLFQAMALCAQTGIDHREGILERIRKIGIQTEQYMLAKTNGVNTQRGILFAAGIVSAAAGRCAAEALCANELNNPLDRRLVTKQCQAIVGTIVEAELQTVANKTQLTNGERVFLQHGIAGIRGELQLGLQSVVGFGLPQYESALQQGLKQPDALAHALVALMAVVEDTVVINRAGLAGYQFMKKTATHAIELGGMLTSEGRVEIASMEQEFVKGNISPGGAADLLAITVMLHELEQLGIDSRCGNE